MKVISRRNMLQISGLSLSGVLLKNAPLSGKSHSSIGKLKIIVSGAHPDDPESGCGGAMALFAAAGHEVVSAYLTRGEAGISGKSHDEAARIRTAEVGNACNILKARPEFLGQIDGNTEITRERYKEVQAFFAKEDPDIVFTHWPVDSHRDHRICSLLTYDAWLNAERKFALFYFEVESGYQTQNFHPTDYINITSVVQQKQNACMAHVSQHPEDWYLDIHKKMEIFRGMESGCDFAEAFIAHNQNPESLIVK